MLVSLRAPPRARPRMGMVMMSTVMTPRAADIRSHCARTISHPRSTVKWASGTPSLVRRFLPPPPGPGLAAPAAGSYPIYNPKRAMIRFAMAIGSLACLLGSASPALPQGNDAAVAARAALDEYIRAWNEEDNDAIAAITNFPRISIGLNGQVIVRDNPEEIVVDFDILRAAEGWDHTTLDLVDATQVSPDKVHFRVVTSRRQADGSPYRTTPALYIITNQGGHWGLQVQSVLPPTFSAR